MNQQLWGGQEGTMQEVVPPDSVQSGRGGTAFYLERTVCAKTLGRQAWRVEAKRRPLRAVNKQIETCDEMKVDRAFWRFPENTA